METYGIISFRETRDAMAAEKQGRQAGFSVRIVPTPAAIVATCGFSLRYELAEEAGLQDYMKQNGMDAENWYHACRQGLKTSYRKING